MTRVDSGTPQDDAGTTKPEEDAGLIDAGTPAIDAGQPPIVIDSGVRDAGTPVQDSGVVVIDAGVPDAGYPAFRTCTPPGTRRLLNGGVVGPTTAPTSCQKPVRASSLTGIQKISLGTHPVNEAVTFTVPPSTGSLTVLQQAVTATDSISINSVPRPNAAAPHLLTTPAGYLLFDDTLPAPINGETANIWFQAPSEVTGAISLPATTAGFSVLNAGVLPAGEWSVTVNDYAAECAGNASLCTSGGNTTGTYDVTVLLRRGPVPSTGTIDIAFYLVSLDLNATDAMTDLNVKRMLDTLATIYARAGLCLGTVTFYDAPGWAKVKYSSGVNADETEACGDLNQMFTLSKSGENTLNLFLVDDIIQSAGGGGTILGIDGAIPGPSSVGGTVKSGAVVNISSLSSSTFCSDTFNPMLCGPDQVAYISAHEGGHWLGLYHTTETNGLLYDPLADSPRCVCSTECVSPALAAKCCDFNTGEYPNGQPCTDTLTRMSGSVCNSTTKPQCAGANHLMFWVIDETSVGHFSAEQSAVVRANPLVQ